MNKIILAVLPLITILTSCTKEKIEGSGAVQTQQRALSNFTKVSVSGNTKVFISRGDNFKVEVKAYSNLLPYLETKVEGDELKTIYKNDKTIVNDNSELYITMPMLTGISAYGNNEFTTTGNFVGSTNFKILITGRSTINVEMGSAENVTIDLTGNGTIHAFGFTANNAVVSLTGKGDIELTAVDKLLVNASGNGNIFYKGNAAVTSNITGTVKIEKK